MMTERKTQMAQASACAKLRVLQVFHHVWFNDSIMFLKKQTSFIKGLFALYFLKRFGYNKVKSTILLSSIFIAINLTACNTSEYVCDPKQRDSIYKHTTFNKDFIENLKHYERLAEFLKTNSDSILTYNSENPGNCAIFYKNDNGKLTHSIMPPSIKNEFTILFKEFDKRSLNYFEICQDGQINIILNRSKGTIDVYHSLLWNQKYSPQKQNDFSNPDLPLFKDTMLNENVKYEISVGCHMR